MKSAPGTPLRALAVVAVAVLAAFLAGSPASAQITFGALSNFDVFNDTGGDCHGFEIELRGIGSADVIYTFGAPYERYGDPRIVPFTDASGSGVYVRYESPYDAAGRRFLERTVPGPSPVSSTDGHSCYNGGPYPAAYDTSGCEHFGVSLSRNATATVYRWLVGDPATGALYRSGTKVSIPAPVWNVVPPADPAAQPVVQAVIEAEPPQAGLEFGEAKWVKIFKTESPDPADLDHLVTDDPAVPQEQAEVEIEWVLLQASVNGGGAGELLQEVELGEGNESVTRRYEFYRYAGYYDPETNEARCDNPTDPTKWVWDRCGAPDASGIAGVGEYIGAQMAAINLDAPAPPVSLTVSRSGAGSGTVASSPLGVDCGATCSAAYPSGTIVTLTAAPAAGSIFTGWSGGGCSGTGACSVTLTAATSVTAGFALVAESADLSVSVKQPSATVTAGNRARYNIGVVNRGPAAAASVVLTVTFAGLQASDVGSIKAPTSCTVSGTAVTCPLGRLNVSSKAIARAVSAVPRTPGTITVTAAVTSGTPDPATGDNAASRSTVVK